MSELSKKGIFEIRLKQLRAEKGWTQDDISRMLEIPKPTYAGYENGIRRPRFETVSQLTELFNTSADYLLGISDDRTPKKMTKDIKKLLELGDYNYEGKDLTNDDLDFFIQMLRRYMNKEDSKKEETKDCNNSRL
jgi:transcriptional regulator with XRE-family HTH domain